MAGAAKGRLREERVRRVMEAAAAAGQITWHGDVHADWVTLTYSLRLEAGIDAGTSVANTIQLDDGTGSVLERTATIIVAGQPLHLPFVHH